MVIKLKHAFVLLISTVFILSSCAQTKPILIIGLIADPQYQDVPSSGERQFSFERIWESTRLSTCRIMYKTRDKMNYLKKF